MDIDKIRELAKLKEEGILSEEEFKQQKDVLLNKNDDVPTTSSSESADLDSSFEKADFDISRLKNTLGYAAIVYFLTMFMPWLSGYTSISGWGMADGGRILSAAAYLVYLVPIGSGFVIYSLVANKPIPGWCRFTGLVPPILLLGAIWKIYDATGGEYFDKIIQQFFENILFETMGIGYWIAFVSGLVLFASAKSSPYVDDYLDEDSQY